MGTALPVDPSAVCFVMLQKRLIRAGDRIRSSGSVGLQIAAVAILAACGKDQPEPRATTERQVVQPAVKPVDSIVPAVVARWNVEDGSAIYLPGDAGLAQVVLPPVLDDSVPAPASAVLPASAAPAAVDLFAPSGRVGSVSVGDYAPAAQPDVGEGCDAWPVVPLREAASIAPLSWRIALQAGVAEPINADSIGGMARSDSAQLVVAINRAAALLPLDSAGVLRRVPFSVSKAYRMRLSGDVEMVVAVVERRLNMEASPRVERTVLVLERLPKTKSFNAVWRETQYATEDDLIAVDLLGVVQFRVRPRPTVFLGQDFGDGSRVQMLQRSEGGIWTLRWSSAYTGC
jgi:hypothetical protein